MARRRDTGPPATGPSEKEVLWGLLSYLRESIAAKAEGVPEPHVRAAGVPSGTSLLGLISHLTQVERHWLLGATVRDWEATFHPDAQATAEEVLAAYRETTRQADEAIAECDDLAAPGPRAGRRTPSWRWTLAHMIEETGRHAGHADILRELVDGATGR
ncbi:DinB family protein [Actinokineospora bangkokensis]|uniref:Mini-circle protein n=1 Tax=Actinokineospora bangkokensis TaxID=1193682 RepID=A0A1Q9LN64_9PSEU|nr:DinB family protein [Actinokineospora bangkokensis]OLR93482.1 mini-circle protein [Actinokineospora bangkokensis]